MLRAQTVAVIITMLVGWTAHAQQLSTSVLLDRETFSTRNYAQLQQLAERVAATVDALIPGRMSEFVRGDIICFQVTEAKTKGLNASLAPPITISANYKLPYEPASTAAGITRIALYEVEAPGGGVYGERFTYQLAHELAHVKMGVRIDNYLLETLAMAVSHEVLVRLGMTAYANREFNLEMRKLPFDIQAALAANRIDEAQRYWQSRMKAPDAITDRPAQTLGAALVRMKEIRWPGLLGIAFATNCPLNNPPTNERLCAPDIGRMKAIRSSLLALGFSLSPEGS